MTRCDALVVLVLGACATTPRKPEPAHPDSKSARPADGKRHDTDGFSIVVPVNWRVTPVPLGVEVRPPGDAAAVVITGGYPVADLETLKSLATADLELERVQEWRERKHDGKRVVSGAWADDRTRLDMHFIADERATVLITIDSVKSAEARVVAAARAIVDTVEIHAIVIDEAIASAPPDGDCPASVRDSIDHKLGVCLEPDVLGAAAMLACAALLSDSNWERDASVESVVAKQTGKTVECHRPPTP